MNTEFMTAAEYADYRTQAIQLLSEHIDATVARNLAALEAELFEYKGQGCFIYDPRGRRYFDASTGGGVFALGHAHPEVVKAVCEQAQLGGLSARVGFVPKMLELLHRLSQIVPGHYGHGHIGSTGTEAIEAALKLARLTTGRSNFVGMESGYHGMSIATMSVSGVPAEGFPPLLPEAVKIPFNDIEAARQAVDDKVAAVILEPIQWAAGCRVADLGYLRQLRQLCTERGALLILDEIQTGMGRTGTWFFAERAGIVPDMIIVGKALSGGMMPISAVMYSDRVHQAQSTHPLFINSTFAGNQLACAAALATLDYMDNQQLLQRVKAMGHQVEAFLNKLVSQYPQVIAGHSGMGLMRCLITTNPAFGFLLATFLQFDGEVCMPALTYDQCKLRISPPYIATDAELAFFFNAVETACQRIASMTPQDIAGYFQGLAAKANRGSSQA